MTTRTPRHRILAILVVIGTVAIAMSVPPVAAQSNDEPAFIVELNADGSAEIVVRSTFDLTTDDEREAFRTLETDEEAQAEATARFLDRMRAVASDAENATGREMQVTNAAIDLRRTADDETGIITLSVTWQGLAAEQGETLRVTEPFASGYSTDRKFVVQAPDGYEVTSANPDPDAQAEESATWNAGTDLTGFAVEVQPVDSPTPTATEAADVGEDTTRSDGQPGFGMLAALFALLATGAVVAVRKANS